MAAIGTLKVPTVVPNINHLSNHFVFLAGSILLTGIIYLTFEAAKSTL